MKIKIIAFVSLFIITFFSFGQEKKQEVFLMGTMHTVPKIVKKSYQPMLRVAKKYDPQAIYVESPMAYDHQSWEYLKNGWSKGYRKFYKLSDSIQKTFDFDQRKFDRILSKKHSEMTDEDLNYLIKSFIHQRDNGNYEYYSYIKKYGIEGAKKPTRHEDGDLTFRLSLWKGHKLVYNMDDQRTNGKFHSAWSKCVKEGVSNGNNAINNKLNKKDYNSAILPAIFRGLGKHTNQRKSLERLHTLSSFSYVIKDTEGCKEGRKYWNERNARMAKNIATQILNSKNERNIVIVGASHIVGLEKELKENYPNLQVKLAYE
jgi:hypothetical protein